MNDLEKQIQLVKEALAFSPDNTPLLNHLSQLLLQNGQEEEAMGILEKIAESSGDEEVILKLAQLYYQRGNLDEAEEFLDGLSQSPGKLMLLSKVFYGKEDYQKAYDLYQQAVEEDSQIEDPDYLKELTAHSVKGKARLRVLDTRTGVWDDIVERPRISFDDVGGLEELKESIKANIIYPFQNPELYKAYGKKIGGGILLYGPPGCGKTFIARATAGTTQANFINIALNDILDMYIGNSEKNLHEIFELARRKGPSVIFIDEIDALGASRQQVSYHGRTLINQFLSELDGIHSDNEGILILGATNTPWHLDSALKRPGRFDRILFVPPPDLKARIEILRLNLKDRPTADIDYMKIAKKTEKYSGADLKALCDLASEKVFQAAIKTGKPIPISTGDLLDALKKMRPSTLEWLSTAKNYATYSNDSGLYDDVLDYFNK